MSQTETNSPTFLMPDPSRFEANLGEAKAELMVTFQRILLYLKTCTQDNPRLEELFTRYKAQMVTELREVWVGFEASTVAELNDLPGPEFVKGMHRVNGDAPAPETFRDLKRNQDPPTGFTPALGKIIAFSALNLRKHAEGPIWHVDIPLLNFAGLIDLLFNSRVESYVKSLLPD